MSARNWASRRIEQPAAAQDLLPDARFEAGLRDEIDPPAEERSEPLLEGEQGHEADSRSLVKFHQEIDIAIRPKVRAQRRAESREFADVEFLAESLEGLGRDLQNRRQLGERYHR
jgi:hypothetical protein